MRTPPPTQLVSRPTQQLPAHGWFDFQRVRRPEPCVSTREEATANITVHSADPCCTTRQKPSNLLKLWRQVAMMGPSLTPMTVCSILWHLLS